MSITLIAAVAENGIIGAGNAMPWRLPSEMAYFKRQTTGKTVLMGRRTFESLKRPLKDRLNVVLSRTMTAAPDGCVLVRSVEEAVSKYGDGEIMVIGGSEIYAQTLPIADKLLITEIRRSYEGDASFPEYDRSAWRLVSRIAGEPNENDPVPYDFCTYERARP